MTTDADPVVRNWYQHLDKGQKFEVIEVDEDRGIVEIQYFDGDLDAVDLDEWYEQEIEPIEAPEDWTGPLDDIERDETDSGEEEWSRPRRGASKRRRATYDEEGEEEEDDEWGEGRADEEPWEDQ